LLAFIASITWFHRFYYVVSSLLLRGFIASITWFHRFYYVVSSLLLRGFIASITWFHRFYAVPWCNKKPPEGGLVI
jgi:hypothetical protein